MSLCGSSDYQLSLIMHGWDQFGMDPNVIQSLREISKEVNEIVPTVDTYTEIQSFKNEIDSIAPSIDNCTILPEHSGGGNEYDDFDRVNLQCNDLQRQLESNGKPKLTYNQIWYSVLFILIGVSIYSVGQSSVGAILFAALKNAAEGGCDPIGFSGWIKDQLRPLIGQHGNPFCSASRHFIFASFTIFIYHVWNLISQTEITEYQGYVLAGITGFKLLVKCIHWSLVKIGIADPNCKVELYSQILKSHNDTLKHKETIISGLLGTSEFSGNLTPEGEQAQALYAKASVAMEKSQEALHILNTYEVNVLNMDIEWNKEIRTMSPEEIDQYLQKEQEQERSAQTRELMMAQQDAINAENIILSADVEIREALEGLLNLETVILSTSPRGGSIKKKRKLKGRKSKKKSKKRTKRRLKKNKK